MTARTWVDGPTGGTPLNAAALNGMESDIASAVSSAAASATSAANSAALVGAPADTAIATAIQGTGTQTAAVLNAAYATYGRAVKPMEIAAANSYGRVPAQASMAPVVTITNDISASTIVSDLKANASGGWYASIAPTDTASLSFIGCSAPYNNPAAAIPDKYAASFTQWQASTLAPYTIELVYTGQILEFYLKQEAGVAFRIMVDGAYLSADSFTLGGTPGNGGGVKIDFGAASATGRVVTFEAAASRFFGIFTQNAGSVSKPVASKPKRILWAGDSYVGGSGPVTSLSTFHRAASWLLGFRDCVNSGSGGTGYLATNAPGVKLRDRVTNDIVNQSPDVVVVTMGHNDTSFTNAAIQAEANLALTAIRSGLPNALIIVTGPLFATPTAGVYKPMQDAIFAGAAGISNLYMIDTCTDPWITADNAGKYILPDGTHPTQIGHDYFAQRMAAAIRTALTPTALTGSFLLNPPLVPINDTFNRADNATTLGATSDGKAAWTAYNGVWGITGNQAYVVSGASQNYVVVDAQKADVTVQATVTGTSSADQGFYIRANGNANGYIVSFNASGSITLYKNVAGTPTSIGAAVAAVTTGDIMKVTATGNSITVYKNGVSMLTVTDSTFPTYTHHGLWGFGAVSAGVRQWDDFSIS